jgi:hypothetical protein
MRHLFILLALLALLAVSVVSAAAKDEGDIVPGTPADNLCYEGGAWDDGRCDIPPHGGSTALAWTCGWYMARYYAGVFTASDVISECQHHIKASEPEPIKEDPCMYYKPVSTVLRGKLAELFAVPCCYYKPAGSTLRLGTRPFGC